MNDFTHIWKFLAKRRGLYFPCVFEFAICRSWRLWRGLYSRPNLFNCFRQKDYNGNMTSSLGCIICCWLFTGNHGKTWHLKAIVRLESPMGTEPMKIDLRLHVMSFKNKMQIYERLLLTTFWQNKLDKPLNMDFCYFDAIFSQRGRRVYDYNLILRENRDIRIRFR